MKGFKITLENSAGPLAEKQVRKEANIKKAILELVDQTTVFYDGDVIRVTELEPGRR